jgi:spermidine synthase
VTLYARALLPWVTVDEARTTDGTVLTLARRGTEWEVCADGLVLMSSRAHGSEDELARLAFAKVKQARTVLIGGLGLGFTLRATLDLLGPRGKVLVAEQSSSVVDWNRAHVGGLAGRPLEDPRVTVRVGGVQGRIREARAAYDVILLDVDNGPAALIHDANAGLYDATGVVACHVALKEGGALAVWASGPDDRYLRRLQRSGFSASAVRVAPRPGAGGRKHVVFVAVKARAATRGGFAGVPTAQPTGHGRRRGDG